MSNSGALIKPEPIREIVFGDITTSYQQFGPQFTRLVRFFTMDNDMDVDIYLSLDGVTDQFRCRPEEAKVFDLKTNDCLINPGDFLYIRAISAASSGDCFVESITT